MSILKATHREAECSNVGVRVGTAAAEEEVARIDTANRTAPIEAVRADIVERTKVDEAAARHGQFERRGKSTGGVILAPT